MFMDKIDNDVIKKMDEYSHKFNEGFPLMSFDGRKKDLINQINKCIKNNAKYEISYEDDEDS